MWWQVSLSVKGRVECVGGGCGSKPANGLSVSLRPVVPPPLADIAYHARVTRRDVVCVCVCVSARARCA